MKKLIVVLVMFAVVFLGPPVGSFVLNNGNGNAPNGGGLSWEVRQQLINAILLQIQLEEQRHEARLALLMQLLGAPAGRPLDGPIQDENNRHDFIMARLLAKLEALGGNNNHAVD